MEAILSGEDFNPDSPLTIDPAQATGSAGLQPKSSESEEIVVNVREETTKERVRQERKASEDFEEEQLSVVANPAVKGPVDPTDYFTDTTEFEELMDSSGVTGPVVSCNKKEPVLVHVPAQDKDASSDSESASESP